MRKIVLSLMKTQYLWLSLLLTFSSFNVYAEGFDYFDSGIDYWNEKKEPSKSKEILRKVEEKKSKFDWDKYMNPENDEFFKEGNYIPPAPFMEFARRPTKENTKRWGEYVERRNQIQKRAIMAAQKYLPQKSYEVPRREIKPLGKMSQERVNKAFKGKWIVFYFDKSCSFCKSMYRTINRLSMSGVVVQAVRLDNSGGPIAGLVIPWEPLKPGEKEKVKIGVTPTILIIEEGSKKISRLTGKRRFEEIIKAAELI